MKPALLLLLLLAALIAAPARAQDVSVAHGYQVFVQHVNEVQDRLAFVSLLDGVETSVLVSGERYTPVRDAVMFYDRLAQRVRLARADGTVQDHPFIQPGLGTRRIDWTISADQRLIAWTITSGDPRALTSATSVSNLDGSNVRLALQDGPRDGIRALPVGFSTDGDTVYLDYQPDSLGDLMPFLQYAGMFSVSLTDGQTASLRDEPGCFCGGGIGFDRFVRLALSADLTGFDVRIDDLQSGAERLAPALKLAGYTLAGDVLISPDGTLAVYALAKVSGLGTAQQSVQTVIVLVDLEAGTQKGLTQPITTFIRPVGWTEDNQAVLFASPTFNGTWKVDLGDGALTKVANAIYVGVIS